MDNRSLHKIFLMNSSTILILSSHDFFGTLIVGQIFFYINNLFQGIDESSRKSEDHLNKILYMSIDLIASNIFNNESRYG